MAGPGARGRSLLTGLLFLVALAGSGCVSAPPLPKEALSGAEAARIYARMTDVVGRKFYDPSFNGRDWPALVREHQPAAEAATTTTALYAELNQLLAQLGVSHLTALSPTEVGEMDAGRRARLGLGWHRYPEGWVIEDVVPGSPAAEAGLQIGWVLAKINGESPEAVLRFRALPGQRIVLTCRDEQGQEHERTMVARVLPSQRAPEERVLPGGVVVLRFDGFDGGSRRWLSEALKRNHRATGVILDLRRNHGGQLFSLGIVVGELFATPVPMGKLVHRDGEIDEPEGRQWLAARYTGPLVVLVDDTTYSAAEMLAHVLQHHRRAWVVGRTTGGAVIASRYYRLPRGGRLVVPVIDYVGLNGQRLEGRGVQPDIVVERSLAALRAGRDLDLEAALRVLAKAPTP